MEQAERISLVLSYGLGNSIKSKKQAFSVSRKRLFPALGSLRVCLPHTVWKREMDYSLKPWAAKLSR